MSLFTQIKIIVSWLFWKFVFDKKCLTMDQEKFAEDRFKITYFL